MGLRIARDAMSRIFVQRCFYLFVMLMALDHRGAVPAATRRPVASSPTPSTRSSSSRRWRRSAARCCRSAWWCCWPCPTLGFQWLGDRSRAIRTWLARSWEIGAALYFVTLVYLLRYVFQPEVMTADKLFGAAAAYLMIGVLWAYLYALVELLLSEFVHWSPGSAATLAFYDGLYLSITVLTSTGFGDITPLSRQARRRSAWCEQITGALFVAILIARLAGVYPPLRPGSPRWRSSLEHALLRQELLQHLQAHVGVVDLEHALLDRQRQRQELRQPVADPRRVVVVALRGKVAAAPRAWR